MRGAWLLWFWFGNGMKGWLNATNAEPGCWPSRSAPERRDGQPSFQRVQTCGMLRLRTAALRPRRAPHTSGCRFRSAASLRSGGRDSFHPFLKDFCERSQTILKESLRGRVKFLRAGIFALNP